jgi:UDP-N-acetylmuramoyl-L-alanyl-D-glutamate--2,6-diaminopimelate ligase
MTTPDPELLYDVLAKMQKRKCDYVVMEVSSHSLALNKTDPIRFEYAIFTNLSKEHMDFHDTMDEYYKSKLSLFSNAKKGLFNMDDAYSRRAFNEVKCEKSSIGILYDADAYATDIECSNLSESAFYYRAPNLIFRVRTRLAGAFNVYNVLCALKCVIDMGVSPCIAKSHLESIHSIDGRMEVIESDITVIIDYAHTAFAFENCLKSLFLANNHRQNISVVFGCGGNRDKTKRAPMGKAASEYTKKIIITEDNNRDEDFSDIVADIAKGISDGVYRVIKDRETAIRTAIYEADAGDIVAIVGKGHERYKIENGKYTPFNERSIVADAIEIRSKGYAH